MTDQTTSISLDEQIEAQKYNVGACEGNKPAHDMENAILASLERLKSSEMPLSINDAPAALTWTTEPPTVPGWYWVQLSMCAPTIKYVSRTDGSAPSIKIRFAGPIEEPSE